MCKFCCFVDYSLYLSDMKKERQTVEEMTMISYYLNALEIGFRAEKYV